MLAAVDYSEEDIETCRTLQAEEWEVLQVRLIMIDFATRSVLTQLFLVVNIPGLSVWKLLKRRDQTRSSRRAVRTEVRHAARGRQSCY